MATPTLQSDPLPLRVDEDGIIRIGQTRVTLDTIIGYYRQGYPIEWIVESYPSVNPADVHAAVTYYLRHRAEVDAYLDDNRRESDRLCQELQARNPEMATLRERLLARKAALDAGESLDEIIARERRGAT